MGSIWKKANKGAHKLLGVDLDGMKEAAKSQADAIRDSSERQAADSANAARAAQQQIEATAAQNAARQAADDLLSRPMETAEVDLMGGDEDDLLGRRRRGGARTAYRGPTAGLNT